MIDQFLDHGLPGAEVCGKNMRPIIVAFLIVLFIYVPAAAQPPARPMLQPAAMQEDFKYLRSMLEATHPGLYMHHTKEAMQYKMDSLAAGLTQPLPFLDFYKKIACLIAEVRCEHTYCNYGDGFGKLINDVKLLPLQLYFLSGKAYILVNGTKEKDIELGDELLTINNYPVDSIRKVLYQYIPSDGYMLTSKDKQMSGMQFNIWYYLFIEQPGSYEVTIRKKNGQLLHKRWNKNISLKNINSLAVKNPVNKRILEIDQQRKKIRKEPLALEWLEGGRTAVMMVQTFSVDKEKFLSTVNSFFDSLAQKNTKLLMIDVSYNGGGEEELAAALVSYFIEQPTRFMEREYLITDSDAHLALSNAPAEAKTDKYAVIEPLQNGYSEVKITPYSQELKILQPRANRFTGKVYVHVSGITSSAASTFAAVMKSNRLATITGEETAGSFSGGGTVIGLDLVLPHSKITAHTSMVYQVFATKNGDGNRGVLPDHPYTPSLDELLDGDKGWREYILELEKNK